MGGQVGLKEIGVKIRNLINSANIKGYRRDLINAVLNLRVLWATELVKIFLLLLLSTNPMDYGNGVELWTLIKKVCLNPYSE